MIIEAILTDPQTDWAYVNGCLSAQTRRTHIYPYAIEVIIEVLSYSIVILAFLRTSYQRDSRHPLPMIYEN